MEVKGGGGDGDQANTIRGLIEYCRLKKVKIQLQKKGPYKNHGDCGPILALNEVQVFL